LQDTLRLLTLWFAHGSHQEVTHNVQQGISSVSVDTWLEVMPQLIARINQPNRLVREAIHNLLVDVGRAHPQALVYPLTVSMKSDLGTRSRSAGRIMEAMRQHSPNLVEQAGLVSHELIRIAVLWHEQWHEGLEEASRLYFGDHNIEGMLATLEPLHEMLRKGPETLREISFIQSFGRDLAEAKDWCEAYKTTREIGDLNQVSIYIPDVYMVLLTNFFHPGLGSLLRRFQTYRQAAASADESGAAVRLARAQECSRSRPCGAWYIPEWQGNH
jgi:FKBP12-rapamycin complex-associated protein